MNGGTEEEEEEGERRERERREQKDVETNLHFPAKIGEKDGRRGDMTARSTEDMCRVQLYHSLWAIMPRLYPSLVHAFKPRPRNIWPGGLIYTQA